MKKIYCNEEKRTVCAIGVHIKFSEEIAFWDEHGYHENPNFIEFWDSVNRKYAKKNLWYVMYCNRASVEEAERGELEYSYLRCLTLDNNCIGIRPAMRFVLTHEPSTCPTTHVVGLSDLITLCKACARYCGGTVDITYSAKERYFEWVDVPTRTITVGKGIRKYRVREPKAKKKCQEVNHTWEHSNEEK